MNLKKKNIANQRFGRLLAIAPTENRINGYVVWECKCDCENVVYMPLNVLQAKTTKSCGCIRKENAAKRAATGQNSRKHGMKGTKAYIAWQHMKQRCFNPANKSFNDYGGRGITVCPEWKDDFQAFFDHVSELPHFNESGYSIDRIDNDGNYEPDNIRWATKAEQNRNRRTYKNSL